MVVQTMTTKQVEWRKPDNVHEPKTRYEKENITQKVHSLLGSFRHGCLLTSLRYCKLIFLGNSFLNYEREDMETCSMAFGVYRQSLLKCSFTWSKSKGKKKDNLNLSHLPPVVDVVYWQCETNKKNHCPRVTLRLPLRISCVDSFCNDSFADFVVGGVLPPTE